MLDDEQTTDDLEPVTEPDPTTEGTEPTPVAKLSREAAARRHEAREAQAERDRWRGVADGLQRGEVERIAGERLTSGADLWLAGVELAELRGEDGALDADLVIAAVDRVVSERPHWALVVPPLDMDGGKGNGQGREAAPMSFGRALKGE